MTRSLDPEQMPVIIFKLISRIDMCVEVVLSGALIFRQIPVVLQEDIKITMLADQSIRHIAAVEITAVTGDAEPEPACGLPAKPEQREPPEIAEKTVDANLFRIVPKISHA